MAKSKKTTPLPGALDPSIAAEAASEQASVKYLDQQALSWSNILKIKKEQTQESKKINDLQEQLNALGAKGVKEATAYSVNLNNIEKQQKKLVEAERVGNKSQIASAKALLKNYEDQDKILLKTAGAKKQAQIEESRRVFGSLAAERALIKSINEERTFGESILEKFRSKKAQQNIIDQRRAKAGGGANVPGPGEGDQKNNLAPALDSIVKAGALMYKTLSTLGPAFKETGNQIKAGLAVPFASAANLLTGQDYGMGGGSVNASGATSMLGGLEKIASSIPLIGGLLGGLVGCLLYTSPSPRD